MATVTREDGARAHKTISSIFERLLGNIGNLVITRDMHCDKSWAVRIYRRVSFSNLGMNREAFPLCAVVIYVCFL